MHQHYNNQVTQPLLLEDLREYGIDISSGGLDHLLTGGLEAFHAEKDGLMPAGIEASDFLQTDNTSARHQGTNCHTLYVGSDRFASFTTSETKSRVNFLRTLLAPNTSHLLGGDAVYYMESMGLPAKIIELAEQRIEKLGDQRYSNAGAWERQLNRWEVDSEEHRRVMTEAVLFNTMLIDTELIVMPLISDDAGQFKVLGLTHRLCWLHAERHVARLVPTNERQRKAYDGERRAIWKYYQRLKAYREQNAITLANPGQMIVKPFLSPVPRHIDGRRHFPIRGVARIRAIGPIRGFSVRPFSKPLPVRKSAYKSARSG